MNHIFYSFVKIALVIILLTFSINKTYSEEENVSLLQQMELLREDIKTLEKAVYSKDSVNNSVSSISNGDDVLTKHLLKLSELEEQFSDEQIRNFQIEKMDMDKLTNKVCEIIADFEEKGMLQSDLWKKLKLNSRDGSRLALRLERRGLISREKILQKGRWTYKLIIEQAPIKLESLIDSPCLTCPVEQKCDFENAYPEPSPLHCQLIEDWVTVEFSKKKR